jgi:sialic acid synthase SpsE
MINDKTSKNDRIYSLLESIENNVKKRAKFMEWARKIMWYVHAGFPFSESQLNDIIEFLENLKKEP